MQLAIFGSIEQRMALRGDQDTWCQRQHPEDGPQQATGGLIWPDEPVQPVRTRVKAEEDEIRVQQDGVPLTKLSSNERQSNR